MSKSEEVEACDRFMTNIVLFILPFEQRRFVLVDYSVCSDAFVISINYDKNQFEYKIKAQKSDLYRYNWKVHRSLCEEIEDPPLSYFDHSVVITFTVV